MTTKRVMLIESDGKLWVRHELTQPDSGTSHYDYPASTRYSALRIMVWSARSAPTIRHMRRTYYVDGRRVTTKELCDLAASELVAAETD